MGKFDADVDLWLGGSRSFSAAMSAHKWQMANPTEATSYQEKFEDDNDLLEELVDSIYQTNNNVAIITVSGSMTNEDSFWNLIFGLTSYNTVSAALNRAVDDEAITDIVVNYSTSGGDAEGIGAVAENIKIANAVKPVYSFSNTKALSAGYWMAAAGRKIYGSPMSEWGSIGAIVVHTSYADMLKERGYEVTVFRGGKYKALGHPAEKLSDKAKKSFQDKVEKLYNFFLTEISQERPSLKIEDKDTWAEGKVFFADDALKAGLIDEVMTFNTLIASLVKVDDEDAGVTSAPGTVGLNDEASNMTKQVILSGAAAAQVASGVDLAEVAHEEKDLEDAGLEGVEGTEGTEAGAEGSEDGQLDGGEAGTEEGSGSIVEFLKAELKTVRSELSEVSSELATLKASSSQADADVSRLKKIAIEATQKLQVSLGQAPMELESLSAEAVAQQYGVSKTAFNRRFKVGQTSLGSEEVDTPDEKPADGRRFGIVPKG